MAGKVINAAWKIIVVNSLIVSQFVCKLMAIHSPEQQYFDKSNQIIRDFVWKGYSSRVNFEQLTKKLEDGGYN